MAHLAQCASYLHKKKRVESLAEVGGFRIRPPPPRRRRLSVCARCPLSLFLSRFHFLSPLQLYHPSVFRHSNKEKHTNTSAKTTQLSIFECYRIKNNLRIFILCTSDPVSISWPSLEFGNFFSSIRIVSGCFSSHIFPPDKFGMERYLYEGQCVAACPEAFYHTRERSCQRCSDHCRLCTSAAHCLQCNSSYYVSEGSCVRLECGEGEQGPCDLHGLLIRCDVTKGTGRAPNLQGALTRKFM